MTGVDVKKDPAYAELASASPERGSECRHLLEFAGTSIRTGQDLVRWAHRILYLDFDGVLHPTFAAPSEAFVQLPLLAQALEGTTCEVVISSSWRFHHDLDSIRRRFPGAMRERIVGTTGEALWGRHARYREILGHFAMYTHPADWRALDDSGFEFPDPCEQLILCPGERGIGPPQLSVLRAWLAQP